MVREIPAGDFPIDLIFYDFHGVPACHFDCVNVHGGDAPRPVMIDQVACGHENPGGGADMDGCDYR